MCNHLSNADAFFLCSALLPWETKYIAKADLFQVRLTLLSSCFCAEDDPPLLPPTLPPSLPPPFVKTDQKQTNAVLSLIFLICLCPSFSFLLLLQVPFGGWAMQLAGDLPVHFTRDHTGWGVKKGTVSRHAVSSLPSSLPPFLFSFSISLPLFRCKAGVTSKRNSSSLLPCSSFPPSLFPGRQDDGAMQILLV